MKKIHHQNSTEIAIITINMIIKKINAELNTRNRSRKRAGRMRGQRDPNIR